MWLSTKHSSVEMEGCSAKVNVLLPWMAKMVDRSRERDGTAHPGQHLTVLNVMLYSKQVGNATIENVGLPTKTTEARKYQRCKGANLILSYTYCKIFFHN